MMRFTVLVSLLASAAACGNSEEAVAGLSGAVDGYCACITTVEKMPTAKIVAVTMLELEKSECGDALDVVKVAQEKLKDHGDPKVQTIRKRQQGCFYRIRDLHKKASLSPSAAN